MKPDRIELRKALGSGKIELDRFIELYFEGNIPSQEYCLSQIQVGISTMDGDIIAEIIFYLSIELFKVDNFLPYLCQLLKMNWHHEHEDIASFLKDARDPSTIDCLSDAATMHLDYLEYDDTYQLARKCIKALKAIGTHEAKEKLKLLVGSSNAIIAGYAKKELARNDV